MDFIMHKRFYYVVLIIFMENSINMMFEKQRYNAVR